MTSDAAFRRYSGNSMENHNFLLMNAEGQERVGRSAAFAVALFLSLTLVGWEAAGLAALFLFRMAAIPFAVWLIEADQL